MEPIHTASSAVLPEHSGDPNTLHIFMLVKATRHWLDMPTTERMAFMKSEVMPLLRSRPELKLRFFDAEAFSARVSDVMFWETADIRAWDWICDHLRDTKFWNHSFEVLEILPSLEGNYFAEVYAPAMQ